MAVSAKKNPRNKQVKSVLNGDEAEFRIQAEMAASAIFIYQGTKIRYINPATEKLTGYSRKELLGMNFYELLPNPAKKIVRDWGMQLKGGKAQSYQGEFKFLTKNEDEKWIELTVGIIHHEGKPAVIGTAYDITERKRAELLQDAVYRIAQAADRSRRLDDLFPAVHAIIAEVMNAENFYIALYNKESDLITFPYYVDQYDQKPSEPSKPKKGLTEYILRTGKSLLCDLATHENLERLGEVELIGTPSPIWLGVPLILDDAVIGVMGVQDYSNPQAYTEREQRILEFVSSQVAMVINRKRSEEALRESEARYHRRVDELTALFEITRELATSQQEISILLQTIVDRAASLLGAPAGSIYLYNKERDELELSVSHGSKMLLGKLFKPGEGIAGKVAESLQPLAVNDYPNWEYRLEEYHDQLVNAIVAAPMLYGGELVGVITVGELAGSKVKNQRSYSQSDVDILMFFAAAAASAVYNTRLFSETRQRLVELELLYQASLSAAQIHNLVAVAQRIVDTLEHYLSWDGSIWLVDFENQRPTLLAHRRKGLSDEFLKGEQDRAGDLISSFEHGFVGWVCQQGRSVRIGDVKKDPRYLELDSKVNSELCVPLKVGGRTIGCINVESDIPNAFSEHDERLLTTLANQAAVVIENARLFEETRRRAIRQAALNTIITTATRAGTDIDTILDTVLEQTLKALNLDIGAIWLASSPRTVQRVAAKGISPSISTIMAEVALTHGAVFSRNIVIDDWSKTKNPLSEPLLSMGIRSAIVVPLISEGKRIGGLIIASSELHVWTTEETTLVETIGREIGAVAERTKLFEETQTRLTELEAVNRISIILRLAKSINEMLPHLIDETLKALDAETGGIWFYNSERDKLQQVISRGWCTNISHLELQKGEGVPGAVFTIGDIYFSSDMQADPRTSETMRESIPTGWSAVSVPIRSEHETIGVFLVSVRLPREFSGEDARLLVTLTEIAGNAIHRMRLNEQTERHAAELEARVAERTGELQDALRKAQAADRLKSEFIANVNHELRTPLTNLVLYYQMLRAQPTVKTEERLNVIGRELQRLRNLIEDLLNLSRLDLGQVTIFPMPNDLNMLIQTLVEDRKSLAEERGLRLSTDLKPGLPPVWLDERMLVQAVSNLLTNAMNYTPSGGQVTIRTMITGHDEDTWVGFSVEDTGLGISDEDMPHLFERFFRGKAAHESGAPGTGLGLAIVKQVAEYHGGRIVVRGGANGHGANFTIWLPCQKEKETEKTVS
jgi:PAS domain S-box-containing protein